MATRANNDVTLSHDDAETAFRLLRDHARGNYSHAKRTKSAAVRDLCIRTARECDRIADAIARALYTWTD